MNRRIDWGPADTLGIGFALALLFIRLFGL